MHLRILVLRGYGSDDVFDFHQPYVSSRLEVFVLKRVERFSVSVLTIADSCRTRCVLMQ